jgi:hypothetical protein
MSRQSVARRVVLCTIIGAVIVAVALVGVAFILWLVAKLRPSFPSTFLNYQTGQYTTAWSNPLLPFRDSRAPANKSRHRM